MASWPMTIDCMCGQTKRESMDERNVLAQWESLGMPSAVFSGLHLDAGRSGQKVLVYPVEIPSDTHGTNIAEDWIVSAGVVDKLRVPNISAYHKRSESPFCWRHAAGV